MGQINDCKFSVMSGGGTPPELPIVFHAATYDPITFELQQELIGVGGETCTHTSEIYAPDHEGVYRAFGENEPVWKDGRVVENYIDNGTPPVSNPVDALTITDLGNETYEISGGIDETKGARYGDTTSGTNNNPYIVRCEVRVIILGSENPQIRLMGGARIDFTNTEWTVMTSSNIKDATHRHFDVIPNTGGTVECRYVQIESAAGRTDTVTPSEFVGDLGKMAYANSNGNTVTDNVVTEGTGTLLDPLPMLVYQGAATNKVPASNYNDGGWTTSATVTNNSDVGIDGVPGTATKVEDTSAADQELIRSEILAVGHSLLVSGRLFIRKEVGVTANARVVITTSNPVSENSVISINLETGAWLHAGGSGVLDMSVTSVGNFWMVCMVVEPTDPTVLDANLEIRPAHYVIDSTSGNAALLGSAVIGNLEIYPDIPLKVLERIGPIFTAGTAVSTDEIINTWAAANHSDAGDSYEADYRLSGEDQILLSMGGTAVLSVVSGDVVLSDGTNSCSTPVVSAEPHIKATYNRVLGAELIANGDFSNGTTGWEAYANGSVIDAIGDQINCETTFEDRGFYQQIPGLIRDKEYIMSVDVLTVTTDNLKISLGSGIGNITSGFIDITTPGHYEHTFTPIGDGDLFLSFSHGSIGNTSVDNVTFRESNMQLDVDGVTATCPYDGTLGSGDLSTKATQRDLIRRES